MGITLTQGTASNLSVAAGVTLTVTHGAARTVGNVVLMAAGAFGTVSSIADNGVAWSKVVDFADADANHDFGDLWWGTVNAANTTATITFSATGWRAAHMFELTGAQKLTSGTVDYDNNSHAGTITRVITTAVDGCFILASVTAFQGNPAGTAVCPANYTQLGHLSNAPSPTATLDGGYWVQPTAGTSTLAFTSMLSGSFGALGAIAVQPTSTGTVTQLFPPIVNMAPYMAA